MTCADSEGGAARISPCRPTRPARADLIVQFLLAGAAGDPQFPFTLQALPDSRGHAAVLRLNTFTSGRALDMDCGFGPLPGDSARNDE